MSARQPLQLRGVPDTARVRHKLVSINCYSSQGATGRVSVPNFTYDCGERSCVEDARPIFPALIVWMAIWLIRKMGCIIVESLFTGGVRGTSDVQMNAICYG
jgi:hypothetical protein